MKPILTAASLFFFVSAFCQKSFEGTVKYALHTPKEKDTLQMQIDFAPQGIKIHVKEPRIDTNNEPEYILISLDSAKVYTIKPRNKSYRSHRLTEKMPATEVPAVKDFAGHRAIGELYNEAGVNNIFGSLLSSKTIFYLAENLMYSIPEKYLSNFELMMVQNGKIVLGAEIHMAPKMFFFGSVSADDSDSSFNKVIVYIEAKEVIERKFDAADFSVPAGFQKNTGLRFT